MKKYFRLNPECFFVSGTKRSAIYNLLTERIMWLNENSTAIMRKAELNEEVTEESAEFLNSLENQHMGNYFDQPVYIDKLRIFNKFNEMKFHKNTPNIEIATIQLTNKCNKNCEFCGRVFCPACVKYNETKGDLSVEEWYSIFNDLILYGLKSVILTGGEAGLYENLNDFIEYFQEKEIFVTVHTNGLIPLKKINDKLGIIISLFDMKDLGKVKENYITCKNVTLMNYTKETVMDASVLKSWKISKTSLEQTSICQANFRKPNLISYYTRKTYDNCLKNKIAIRHDGTVYPCFQSKKPVASVKETPFHLIVRDLVMEYWGVSIDMEDKKCARCEFRYTCSSCKFSSVDTACVYDVEESVWKLE